MKINIKLYDLVLYNYPLKRIISFLLRQPFVYNNPVYDYYYQKIIVKKMRLYRKKPFRIMIENTNICMANCVFCPHRLMRRPVGVMGMGLYKKIIDQCKKYGLDFVTVYGFGEPLLDKDFFNRIKYAKQKGIRRVTTNTNAMYLDKKAVQAVFESGLDEIYISFDAVTAATYRRIRPGLDFATVKQNISFLIKEKAKRKVAKPEIVLSFVESDINKHEIKKYLQEWKSKADGVSISLLHNWTGVVKNSRQKTTGRRDPCRLLWTDMVVSWNGDVPLCCTDYENKIILGNIAKDSIGKIWGGKKLANIRQQQMQRQFNKISLCRNCEYNYHHKSPWWVGK